MGEISVALSDKRMPPSLATLFLAALAMTGSLRWFAPEYIIRQSVLSTLVTLFIIFSVVRSAWAWFIYPKLLSPLRNLPQPSGAHFFLGQFGKILAEPTGDPHLRWMETIKNDGLIYYTSVFNAPRLFVTSPETCREVMVTRSYEFIKPPQFAQGLIRILGLGILFAEGDEHKRQRRDLSPAFSFRHVKDLYPIFWSKTREMILELDKAISLPHVDSEKTSNIIEVNDTASATTLDIIGASGMGRDFNAIKDPSNELYRTYNLIIRPSKAARILGLLSFFTSPWLINKLPVKRNNDIGKASGFIRALCRDLIKGKKEAMADGKASDVDILSVALSSGGFTEENLVDQMMTFLAAGHETTASALTWAIYLLCKNPTMQTRLRDELRSYNVPSIRDPTSMITPEAIDHIPYLHAVCNEVLRLIPPVPMTQRVASTDTHIGSQFVPAGTPIVIAPRALNRYTGFWGADALEFKPERWMGPGRMNTGGAESNFAFTTFLHGPRSCIGQGFARAEFACLLAGWVQAFETALLEPEKEVEIGGGLTHRPKHGLKVLLTAAEL